MLLNCKLENEGYTESIQKEIEEKLGIKNCEINFKFDKVHSKFSESAKVIKEYHHYFYEVVLHLSNVNKEFERNHIHFKWYSYQELLLDKRIQEVNADIVEMIKKGE